MITDPKFQQSSLKKHYDKFFGTDKKDSYINTSMNILSDIVNEKQTYLFSASKSEKSLPNSIILPISGKDFIGKEIQRTQ